MWIKAGQLISLRTDLLSREMANELSQLTYLTNGFEPDIARQVVEDELGRPIEDVFDVWDAHPFAAASISQVHRARLRSNGVWVAVKVQRPGIKQVFARDLKLISRILRMMKRMPGLGFITWDGMIRELERMMTEEVDYRYETANLRRMRKLL
ncbi:MAG: AarF/ABC1/UbiB kinase family protein, partial [Anaerolineae bacterium]|nr:AarF/ABC1/UbiB kinase family protein [Anaerolineae bacterium]